ncbi:unnamed protein product [Pleuronectes platessa]|uniref:Uncharacterized protein n=1 Tax=Pleuronectes platessa TaxID=8262 RepID=A0A9N7W4K8_PLEPL|nr:unnamed protein product [Pleuronectes platessa]
MSADLLLQQLKCGEACSHVAMPVRIFGGCISIFSRSWVQIWFCQPLSTGHVFSELKLNIAGLELQSRGELTLLTYLECAIWILLILNSDH